MAASTSATFQALRKQTEDALVKLELSDPNATLPENPKERSKALAIFDKRATIELLASTSWQRAAVPDWHENFMMLREVNDDLVNECSLPGIQNKQQLRSALWHGGRYNPLGGLPDCAFRRFQEIFCDPAHFIVPRFDVRDGKIVFRHDPHSLSVAPCLVSADRIPEDLAVELGLIPLDNTRRSRMFRLTRKAEKPAIQGLKKIWDRAEYLGPRNKRIMAIRQHPSREVTFSDALSDTPAPNPALCGKFLYTREFDQGNATDEFSHFLTAKGNPYRRLSLQFFSSVFAAHRKTIHETTAHDTEITKVTQLKQTARTHVDRLKREWRPETASDLKKQLEEETKSLFSRGRQLLHEVTNRNKLAALELFERADGVADRTGRPNPIATTSRLIRACTMLEKRLNEMAPIGGANRQDQMLLKQRIDAHKAATAAIRREIPEIANKFKLKLAIFSGRPLSPRDPSKEEASVAKEVRNLLGSFSIPSQIDALTDEPFLAIREKLGLLWSELEENFSKRSRDNAAVTVVKMHVVGKFSRLLEAIEDLKEELATRSLTLEGATAHMRSLEGVFEAREILPDVTVRGYSSKYDEMSARLKKMRERLEERCLQELSEKQRSQILTAFKDYIAGVDILGIVRELQ